MNAIAIIKTRSPTVDSIIVWDDGTRLVAIGYQAGQTKMTRPVTSIEEALDAFQITDGQLTALDAPRRVVGGNRWL